MQNEIFKSERYFTIFDTIVSHGQLLLRSQKGGDYDDNIDIIFFSADYIQLYSMLKGVKIKRLDINSVIDYNSVVKYLSFDNHYLFEIESDKEKYYVAASFIRVFSNTLDFNETSLGFSNIGRENEIANSFS